MTDMTHPPQESTGLMDTVALDTPTDTPVVDSAHWNQGLSKSPALAMTLDSLDPPHTPSAQAATLGMDAGASLSPTKALSTSTSRTTVLPRAKHAPGESMTLTCDARERYQHRSVLGQGGVGEVVLVHDNDIDRDVAMKRLHSNVSEKTGSVLRFAEEVRTMGQLDHPNIVPIHDVGVDVEGHYFFIMKQAEGETLEAIIEKLATGDPAYHARFTMEVRTQIVMELLRALQFAHERGIVHRDIKPSNVMVGPYNEVVLMDWGLAKRLDAPSSYLADSLVADEGTDYQAIDLNETLDDADAADTIDTNRSSLRLIQTQHGAILGTPAYLSPEQARGDVAQLDARCDIYSVSALCYELLTLEHYLPGRNTLSQLMLAVLRDEPEPPSTLQNPHQDPVSVPLSNFVLRGLTKDPDGRWDSVGEMMEELRRIQEGRIHVECMVTFAKSSTRRLDKWIDRNPKLTIAMMVMVPAGLVAVVVAALLMFVAG
ncbi:MAG: serine/threonine-protein kinase [Myxococcota bacterium]